jgi:hypothetical protein
MSEIVPGPIAEKTSVSALRNTFSQGSNPLKTSPSMSKISSTAAKPDCVLNNTRQSKFYTLEKSQSDGADQKVQEQYVVQSLKPDLGTERKPGRNLQDNERQSIPLQKTTTSSQHEAAPANQDEIQPQGTDIYKEKPIAGIRQTPISHTDQARLSVENENSPQIAVQEDLIQRNILKTASNAIPAQISRVPITTLQSHIKPIQKTPTPSINIGKKVELPDMEVEKQTIDAMLLSLQSFPDTVNANATQYETGESVASTSESKAFAETFDSTESSGTTSEEVFDCIIIEENPQVAQKIVIRAMPNTFKAAPENQATSMKTGEILKNQQKWTHENMAMKRSQESRRVSFTSTAQRQQATVAEIPNSCQPIPLNSAFSNLGTYQTLSSTCDAILNQQVFPSNSVAQGKFDAITAFTNDTNEWKINEVDGDKNAQQAETLNKSVSSTTDLVSRSNTVIPKKPVPVQPSVETITASSPAQLECRPSVISNYLRNSMKTNQAPSVFINRSDAPNLNARLEQLILAMESKLSVADHLPRPSAVSTLLQNRLPTQSKNSLVISSPKKAKATRPFQLPEKPSPQKVADIPAIKEEGTSSSVTGNNQICCMIRLNFF